MTEKEKMLQGLWYDAIYDRELNEERLTAKELCWQLNRLSPRSQIAREKILRQLLPHLGQDVTILSPFMADYGYNCYIGNNTFINHNVYLMDCAPIRIGAGSSIGPNCGFYTAIHPLVANERDSGLETAQPITLAGDNWIGGDVTILPGVAIGKGSVIGAKSLVAKDIPAGVLAMGNPCRVVREITDSDCIS